VDGMKRFERKGKPLMAGHGSPLARSPGCMVIYDYQRVNRVSSKTIGKCLAYHNALSLVPLVEGM